MTSEIRAVFVVERDSHDVFAFPSLDRAAGSVESYDVESGEYEFFADDGTVLEPTVVERFKVVLKPTSRRDLERLMEHLRAWISAAHISIAPDETDPVVLARAISDTHWRARRPSKPGWLRRRLYGDGPPEFPMRERPG
jgi:hypothetical protein